MPNYIPMESGVSPIQIDGPTLSRCICDVILNPGKIYTHGRYFYMTTDSTFYGATRLCCFPGDSICIIWYTGDVCTDRVSHIQIMGDTTIVYDSLLHQFYTPNHGGLPK
jgi:hypothetical protein